MNQNGKEPTKWRADQEKLEEFEPVFLPQKYIHRRSIQKRTFLVGGFEDKLFPVKVAQIFTAGFSETGEEEAGEKLEQMTRSYMPVPYFYILRLFLPAYIHRIRASWMKPATFWYVSGTRNAPQ